MMPRDIKKEISKPVKKEITSQIQAKIGEALLDQKIHFSKEEFDARLKKAARHFSSVIFKSLKKKIRQQKKSVPVKKKAVAPKKAAKKH